MTYGKIGVFLLKAAALLLVAGYSTFGANPAWKGASNPLRIYVDSTNARVGIGTPDPASKLHVTDTLTLGSFPSSYAQIYQNTETDDCLYINNHRAVTGSNIYFQTGSMTKMTILQNGNIGIGTASPASKLHVTDTLTLGSFPSSYAQIYQNTETDDCLYINNHRAVTGSNIYFQMGSMTKMTILQNGNVGIDINPTGTERLQVNGKIKVWDNINLYGHYLSGDGDNEGVFVDVSGSVGVGVTNPGSFKLAVDGSINTYKDLILGQTTSNSWIIHSNQNGTPAGHVLTIAPSDGAGNYDWFKNITIHRESGNVGIGDGGTEHDEKLYVNGDIKVNGKIMINTWTIEAPPDYVFEKDYKPKSLEEVEKFIHVNKHLPEIPSAAEIKAKGVELTEMNMKLLKKIEELTLYIIDQNKKIENLEKKVFAITTMKK